MLVNKLGVDVLLQTSFLQVFMTKDFNRFMQLRPFYFDIQINVSP